jgi:hypothetical protein
MQINTNQMGKLIERVVAWMEILSAEFAMIERSSLLGMALKVRP